MIKTIADPSIIAIPIKECGEPLVDLRQQTYIAFGPPPERPDNICYTKLRKTVYDKLCQAQDLLPKGIRFCLYEGWRSLDLQNELFQSMYENNRNTQPHLTPQELFIETTKLVSPLVLLDGSRNIPPHATGAAIDVYLIGPDNAPLNMGILLDQWSSDHGGRLSCTHSSYIDQEAKHHRHIMTSALSQVDFVNYPNEYWHWSYGDRYWAYHRQASHAIYNVITPQ
ncbi:MAG: D-alanyl-D-alanine carboxypeptidase family protein [Simkania sp.]|nr:D-alanyl-D-alanine carboxypeptidase family protein [Simkania sp.]